MTPTTPVPVTRALLRELAPALDEYRMTLDVRCDCRCTCHGAMPCHRTIDLGTLDCDKSCRAAHVLGSDCQVDAQRAELRPTTMVRS